MSVTLIGIAFTAVMWVFISALQLLYLQGDFLYSKNRFHLFDDKIIFDEGAGVSEGYVKDIYFDKPAYIFFTPVLSLVFVALICEISYEKIVGSLHNMLFTIEE